MSNRIDHHAAKPAGMKTLGQLCPWAARRGRRD